jgi:hypothetical protein
VLIGESGRSWNPLFVLVSTCGCQPQIPVSRLLDIVPHNAYLYNAPPNPHLVWKNYTAQQSPGAYVVLSTSYSGIKHTTLNNPALINYKQPLSLWLWLCSSGRYTQTRTLIKIGWSMHYPLIISPTFSIDRFLRTKAPPNQEQ